MLVDSSSRQAVHLLDNEYWWEMAVRGQALRQAGTLELAAGTLSVVALHILSLSSPMYLNHEPPVAAFLCLFH